MERKCNNPLKKVADEIGLVYKKCKLGPDEEIKGDYREREISARTYTGIEGAYGGTTVEVEYDGLVNSENTTVLMMRDKSLWSRLTGWGSAGKTMQIKNPVVDEIFSIKIVDDWYLEESNFKRLFDDKTIYKLLILKKDITFMRITRNKIEVFKRGEQYLNYKVLIDLMCDLAEKLEQVKSKR